MQKNKWLKDYERDIHGLKAELQLVNFCWSVDFFARPITEIKPYWTDFVDGWL